MQNFQIEVDVDGVLANLNGSYAPYVSDIIPDWSEEKYINSWDLVDLKADYPEVVKRIMTLWRNPVFMGSLGYKEGVVEGMKELCTYAKEHKTRVLIHTHLMGTADLVYARVKWLEQLKRDAGVNFDICLSVGHKKETIKGTNVLIEDCVEHLQKSTAEYKILIRCGHNRMYNEADLGDCKKAFIANTFSDAVQFIKALRRDNDD